MCRAATLGALLRLLRDDDTLRPSELTWLVELSARRARDHVPLDAVVAAYLRTGRNRRRTGLDPADPAHARTLQAALTVRELI